MQYRKFGKLDWEVSALGFGAMRLPKKDDDIDEPEAIKMIHHAIDQGINYIDTAYPYHKGQSEVLVGKALQGKYREKVKLATKMPSWAINEAADFDKYFNEQLERLQTDRVDCYLLHALNAKWWPKLRDFGVIEWAENAIAEGRIGCLGFSFHDKNPVFEEIVDAYDWAFCQIQYNYMDTENQAGMKGLQYADSKGLAVIVMEPVLGGKLIDPPQSIQELWDSAEKSRTAADWALQWIWNQPEVAFILSGMSTMRQLEENIASADISGINILTTEELALIERVREKYKDLSPIPCTQCEYCLPCPEGVGIPRNFEAYNKGIMYDKQDDARNEYQTGIPKEKRARLCIQCGVCEEKCPQQIPISQWMPVVHEVLGEGKPYQRNIS